MKKENKNELKYCLFSGRHELPENEGAIFEEFNFSSYKGVRTKLFDQAVSALRSNKKVILYVTGLTPGLTEFLSETKQYQTLVLMHYNSQTREYIAKKF